MNFYKIFVPFIFNRTLYNETELKYRIVVLLSLKRRAVVFLFITRFVRHTKVRKWTLIRSNTIYDLRSILIEDLKRTFKVTFLQS